MERCQSLVYCAALEKPCSERNLGFKSQSLRYSPIWRNITKQEEKILVKITKKEMEYLKSNGCVWEDELHHTIGKGKKKTYYATESRKILNLLSNYRKNRITN